MLRSLLWLLIASAVFYSALWADTFWAAVHESFWLSLFLILVAMATLMWMLLCGARQRQVNIS